MNSLSAFEIFVSDLGLCVILKISNPKNLFLSHILLMFGTVQKHEFNSSSRCGFLFHCGSGYICNRNHWKSFRCLRHGFQEKVIKEISQVCFIIDIGRPFCCFVCGTRRTIKSEPLNYLDISVCFNF